MEQGIIILIIGGVLVYGARILSKMIKWVSLLTLKIIGFIIVILGVLKVFGTI
jgi:hypothetical protein